MSRNVDKLILVGFFSLTTPNVVVEEIGRWLLLDFDSNLLKDEIYRAKVVVSVMKIYEKEKDEFYTKDIGRFINFVNPNPDFEWRQMILFTAMDHISNFLMGKVAKPIFALPTPQKPRSISPAILFSFLRKAGVKLRYETSFDDMIRIYQTLNMSPKELQIEVIEKISDITDGTLLRSLLLQCFESKSPILETNVNLEHELLSIVHLIVPDVRENAIILGLNYFKKNLSHSINPRTEFLRIKNGLSFFDETMKSIEILNPRAYDIRYVFHPDVPEKYYEKVHLFSIAENYGLKMREGVYNELILLHMTDNFHLGVQSGVRNFQTLIDREDLRELGHNQNVISFGSFSNGYDLHLFSELTRNFKSNLSFKNPRGGYFNYEQIKVLISLLKNSYPRRSGSRRKKESELTQPWDELQNSINNILLFQDENQKHCLDLVKMYNSGTNRVKKDIENFFTLIFFMSLHMRGWNDTTKEWPISVVPTCDPDLTDINVWRKLGEFKEEMKKNSVAEFLLNLPLLTYQNNEFHISTDSAKGLTIGDRIKIVDIGLDSDNINGCYRTSSNWFLYSCQRYMNLLDMKPGFEPYDVHEIS